MSIYLDHNATAPLLSGVKAAMAESMEWVGNPSSIHRYGRQVRQKLEDVRATVAEYFGASPANVVFTSGATEANNTLIQGFKGRVIISAVEHDSVAYANDDAQVCHVDSDGLLDLKKLESLLSQSDEPTLVSVMVANNETGIIQPLHEIIQISRRHKAFVHTDAVQAVGRLDLDWAEYQFDAITYSTHKVGGPQGVGGYVAKANLPFKVPFRGGGQERSYRPGTENIIGLIGMGVAFKLIDFDQWHRIALLRNRLESEILALSPEVTIFGRDVDRLANTSNFTMPGVKSETQVMAFDLRNIAVSAGSACSSGKVKASRVLQAMGIPKTKADTALRVSLGCETTEADILTFIDAWSDIYKQAKKGAAA